MLLMTPFIEVAEVTADLMIELDTLVNKLTTDSPADLSEMAVAEDEVIRFGDD